MSSRKELKEQRRQERLERERADQQAQQRRKRVGFAAAGFGAVAAVAGAVVLAMSLDGGGGGDDGGSARNVAESGLPALPEQRESDVKRAAEAAGCKLTNARYEGAGHADKQFKPSDYKTNPPTSGAHFPQWYEDGIYEPGNSPELGKLVHTLEHGRINVQYRKGTSADIRLKLEALMAEQSDGYHMLLHENATDMPYAVAATAWTQMLGCEQYSDKALDALRTFRARYIDKGPERVP